MEKSTCDHIGFDDRKFRLIGIPLTAFVAPLIFFRDGSLAGYPWWQNYLVSMLFTTVIWEGSRLIFIAGSRRYPELSQIKKRLLWISGFAVLYAMLACQFINWVLLQFGHYHSGLGFREKYSAQMFLLLTVGAIYESARFFNLWKKTLSEKQQLEREHLSSQLEGLRNQVNPHFLFNSLNTLVWLIPEHPDKAVGFVRQLSKVYRYVLENREAGMISLREEADFLEAYIALLRERFGENLLVELQMPEHPETVGIVPLTLQMLFENAIKHNIVSAEKPLKIEVFSENGHLVIRNGLQRKSQVSDSTGVGLENIRSRYRILTGKEVDVIVSQQYFTVLLPKIVKSAHL